MVESLNFFFFNHGGIATARTAPGPPPHHRTVLVRAERRKMGLAAELRQGAGVDPRIDARRKARPRAPAPMVHPNDNDGCC